MVGLILLWHRWEVVLTAPVTGEPKGILGPFATRRAALRAKWGREEWTLDARIRRVGAP